MLFWIGLLSVILGLVFKFNGTEWFAGENNLVTPLLLIGGALMVLYFVILAVVLSVAKSAHKRFSRF